MRFSMNSPALAASFSVVRCCVLGDRNASSMRSDAMGTTTIDWNWKVVVSLYLAFFSFVAFCETKRTQGIAFYAKLTNENAISWSNGALGNVCLAKSIIGIDMIFVCLHLKGEVIGLLTLMGPEWSMRGELQVTVRWPREACPFPCLDIILVNATPWRPNEVIAFWHSFEARTFQD